MADAGDITALGTGPARRGRLRICAAVTFARLHVIPNLPVFLAEHPDLTIEITADDWDLDLTAAEIDLALRIGRGPRTLLPARKIGESKRLVLGAPAYFARAGEPLTPTDLIAHQAVIHDQFTGGADWTFRRGLIETPVTMRGRVHVTAAEGIREAVFAGIGLAVASEWMFAPELASGAVKPVLQDWTLPPLDLWAVFPSDYPADTTAHALADFIEARLSRCRPH